MSEAARHFIDAWNADERHRVDEWAASVLIVLYTHFPEPLQGPEAVKEIPAQTHHFGPDVSIEVDTVVRDGSQAVIDNFGLMIQLGAGPRTSGNA